ncbi:MULTISPECIES: MFS transporter [unclassified Vibrio]|uniref:MFS transporter n=1 Tax=unclassified Vibrio TaxID=2614977 RepID=UPI000B8EA6BF|nr:MULTISPECIES: MFS transporter [unclassified Vibrio]EHI9239247.1 MFS transporter [Vibrio vulnificus]EIJ0985102.1 MFS transporter [Vibrio vulnificus]NAX17040.1 MFS transporter [Vibrio sp. V22_P2S10T140]OXX43278.1 hypothetical protein B9J83_09540 [Vibrio sp. V07_P2A8T137]OXX57545.1 hypothetical protein B9J82_09935 [Vibrio sp. V10_P2A27P122]
MTSKILIFVFFNFVASVAIGVSLIVIPWSIVSIDGTGEALVSASLITTVLLAFASPFAGKFIDLCSRRNFTFSLLLFMGVALYAAGIAIDSGLYKALVLMAYFGFTQLFFMLYYNVRGAFIQERFSEDERNNVNSLMEFETQLASLLSSVITITFLTEGHFSQTIIFCSVALVLAAVAVLLCFSSKEVTGDKVEPIQKEKQSVHKIVSTYKPLIFFGVAVNAPFLIVMATNIINPVYFNGVQLSDISIIATISVVYTISAMVGASSFPKLSKTYPINTIVALALALSLGAGLLATVVGGEIAVIVASFVWGATNALCKVSYNTVVMKQVAQHQIGQYFSIIQAAIYIFRTLISIVLLSLIKFEISFNLYVITLVISLVALMVMVEFKKSKAIYSKEA